MAEEKEKKSLGTSLLGGIVMTIVLVVIVPVLISWLIQPYVEDFIGNTSLLGLTSGTIGAIVMFIILIIFMLLLGGGAILRKYGVIGVVGLIVAYILLGFFVDEAFYTGWILPVIIVCILGGVSYLRDKKKNK
jgi:predicted Na+-dependent transporter